jgi:RNA polymerase primary sigma factor
MDAEDRVYTQYYRDVSRTTMPANAHEERELFRRYYESKDQDARRRIVEGGLRFVIKIARQYHHGNMEFLKTLIAAGNVGLLIAVDRYRPWVILCHHCKKKVYVPHPKRQRCSHCGHALRSKNAEHYTTRFLTYAAWWIAETIRTELYESSLVRIPTYRQKEQPRGSRTEKAHKFYYVSFEEELDELQETLDEDEEAVIASRARDLLHTLLRTMNDRQAYVVIAYYGLREDPKTLKEIGQKLGLCSERVRQIKVNALADLRKQLLRMRSVDAN